MFHMIIIQFNNILIDGIVVAEHNDYDEEADGEEEDA